MKRERHAILSLIALGRITPAEAERLLALCGGGREELAVIAICLTACLAQFFPALVRVANTLLGGGLPALHHAVTAITYWIGGVL
jgi:hypothetical protein